MTDFTVRSGEGGRGAARAGLPSAGVPAGGWAVEVVDGTVSDVLAAAPRSVRTVRVVHPSGVAVVLGRAQPRDHVDDAVASAHGFTVVRRMSGGSAVLVEPGRLVWVDVTVPAGDGLWDRDIGRAAWWLGECWASALAALGVDGASVHRAGMVRGQWADRVCFDGVGSGEVTIDHRKVVGIAQRRTRTAALFQCAALIEWNPTPLADVLGVPVGDLRESGAGLRDLAGVGPAEVEAAFLSALP